MFIIAAITDIKKDIIPNAVVFPALLAGLVFSVVQKDWKSLIISGVSLIVLFFVFALGFVGGGDIKLLMADIALCGLLNGLVTLGGGALLSILFFLLKEPKSTANSVKYGLNCAASGNMSAMISGKKLKFAPFMLVSWTIISALQLLHVIGG